MRSVRKIKIRFVLYASLPIGLILALAGCTAYPAQYEYSPRLGQNAVDLPGTASDPDARVLVTIGKVRRSLLDEASETGIEIKLRVENLADSSLRLVPREVSVLTGTLEALRGPIDPPPPLELPGGEETTLTLLYALPRREVAEDAMAGLNVRVPLELGGQRVTRSLDFDRRREDRRGHYRYHHLSYYRGHHHRFHHGHFFHHW